MEVDLQPLTLTLFQLQGKLAVASLEESTVV